MRPNEIKVGDTYRNRGAGRVTRRVLEISWYARPEHWLGSDETQPKNEKGVRFVDSKGREGRLYLSSFAAWAGNVVEAGNVAETP